MGEIMYKMNRREFLRISAMTVGGVSLAGCSSLLRENLSVKPVPPIEIVRVGVIGVGIRGKSLLSELLKFDSVDVRAVCDIIERKVESAQQTVIAAGKPKVAGYYHGEADYRRLCARDDIDLVVIATPWHWHTAMCVEAMRAGKHAATEVPAAITVEECWQLVTTSEKTGQYCTMLENCCYDRTEMMVLNMVRKGLLGELVHAECGYIHDRRSRIFSDRYEGMWHLKGETKYTGNTYPTHGLGPVAQYMNINRGDRFDYMVSVSTPPKGLKAYAAEHFGPDHKWANLKYTVGDVNVSLIKTVNGKTITLYFNWANSRPYSRVNLVQGIKGIFRWPNKIQIDGRGSSWESVEPYIDEYEHPLWKSLREKAKGGGHGGMDYMMIYRLIKALQTGTPPDIDVYDAASWSAVFPLSGRSMAKRGRSVDFPDFTRGTWKTNQPLAVLKA